MLTMRLSYDRLYNWHCTFDGLMIIIKIGNPKPEGKNRVSYLIEVSKCRWKA